MRLQRLDDREDGAGKLVADWLAAAGNRDSLANVVPASGRDIRLLGRIVCRLVRHACSLHRHAGLTNAISGIPASCATRLCRRLEEARLLRGVAGGGRFESNALGLSAEFLRFRGKGPLLDRFSTTLFTNRRATRPIEYKKQSSRDFRSRGIFIVASSKKDRGLACPWAEIHT